MTPLLSPVAKYDSVGWIASEVKLSFALCGASLAEGQPSKEMKSFSLLLLLPDARTAIWILRLPRMTTWRPSLETCIVKAPLHFPSRTIFFDAGLGAAAPSVVPALGALEAVRFRLTL